MPEVTLLIPGLDWDRDWLGNRDIRERPHVSWADYFYRQGSKNFTPLTYSDLLSNFLLTADLTAALSTYGGLEPAKNYTVLSPVTQKMNLHHMQVFGGQDILDLTLAEAREYGSLLNELYAADGYVFHALTPTLWLLETEGKLDFTTLTPYDLSGGRLESYELTGGTAAVVRRLQAEIQMFLPELPLNRQRQKHGKAVINGLWFWPEIKGNAAAASAKFSLSADFSWLAGVRALPDYKSLAAAVLAAGQAAAVVFIDTLTALTNLFAYSAFARESELSGTELIWPLIEAYEQRKISRLHLVSCGATGGIITLKRRNLLKWFYRKAYGGRWLRP